MMVVSPASAPAAPALSGARGDVASHKGGFAGALSAQHEGASAAGEVLPQSLRPAPAPATVEAGVESDAETALDAEATAAFDGATTLASLQARAEPQTAPTPPVGAALPGADEPTAPEPAAAPVEGRAVNARTALVTPTPAESRDTARTAVGAEADPEAGAATEPVALAAGAREATAQRVTGSPRASTDVARTAEADAVASSMPGPSVDPEDVAPANAADVPDTPVSWAGASTVPATAVHTDDLPRDAAAAADRPAARFTAVAGAAAAGGAPPLSGLEMAGAQAPALADAAGTSNVSPATAITASAGSAMATGPAASPAAGPALPPLPIADAAAALAEHIETMADDEVWQMKLRLDPPRLGTVDVHLAVRDQQVAVSLVSGDAQARMLLAQALPELSNALAAKGLQLMGADVGQSSSQGRDDAPARRVARPAREAAADLGRGAPQAAARQGLLDRYA